MNIGASTTNRFPEPTVAGGSSLHCLWIAKKCDPRGDKALDHWRSEPAKLICVGILKELISIAVSHASYDYRELLKDSELLHARCNDELDVLRPIFETKSLLDELGAVKPTDGMGHVSNS